MSPLVLTLVRLSEKRRRKPPTYQRHHIRSSSQCFAILRYVRLYGTTRPWPMGMVHSCQIEGNLPVSSIDPMISHFARSPTSLDPDLWLTQDKQYVIAFASRSHQPSFVLYAESSNGEAAANHYVTPAGSSHHPLRPPARPNYKTAMELPSRRGSINS